MIKVAGKRIESLKDVGIQAITEADEVVTIPQGGLREWDNEEEEGLSFTDGIEIVIDWLPRKIKYIRIFLDN